MQRREGGSFDVLPYRSNQHLDKPMQACAHRSHATEGLEHSCADFGRLYDVRTRSLLILESSMTVYNYRAFAGALAWHLRRPALGWLDLEFKWL